MYTFDLQAKIETYRAKASAGTLTREELREAIEMLRAQRPDANREVPAKGVAKGKKPAIDSNDLLSELEGL